MYMSNQRMIYLVNKDNPDAMNLAKVMSEGAHKEGAIFPVSKGEMECYGSDDFQAINLNDVTNNLVRVYPSSNYILFADEHTDIDDVIQTQERLGIMIGVIRNNNA